MCGVVMYKVWRTCYGKGQWQRGRGREEKEAQKGKTAHAPFFCAVNVGGEGVKVWCAGVWQRVEGEVG